MADMCILKHKQIIDNSSNIFTSKQQFDSNNDINLWRQVKQNDTFKFGFDVKRRDSYNCRVDYYTLQNAHQSEWR